MIPASKTIHHAADNQFSDRLILFRIGQWLWYHILCPCSCMRVERISPAESSHPLVVIYDHFPGREGDGDVVGPVDRRIRIRYHTLRSHGLLKLFLGFVRNERLRVATPSSNRKLKSATVIISKCRILFLPLWTYMCACVLRGIIAVLIWGYCIGTELSDQSE